MKELLKNLFSACNFSLEELSADALFFTPNDRSKVEYYLIYFIAKDLLNTYSAADAFLQVIQVFRAKRLTLNDIDKNTALILCIQMDNLEADCMELKYDILKIEEKDFQFKHYVLPYTNSALTSFPSDESLRDYLNNKINDNTAFNRYFSSFYHDEAYFVAMQLFLKLPFLGPLPRQSVSFQTVDQMVNQSIATAGIQSFYDIATAEALSEIDWDAIQISALNLGSDAFDQFLLKFTPNGN